jgi:hypothetical protein
LLERLSEEIKRRTHVVRIFPNAESCLRLIRALALPTRAHHRYHDPNRRTFWTQLFLRAGVLPIGRETRPAAGILPGDQELADGGQAPTPLLCGRARGRQGPYQGIHLPLIEGDWRFVVY